MIAAGARGRAAAGPQLKTYVVEPGFVDAQGAQRWVLRCEGVLLATFGTRETACEAARSLGRLDVLAGRETEAWLHGSGPAPLRIPLGRMAASASGTEPETT